MPFSPSYTQFPLTGCFGTRGLWLKKSLFIILFNPNKFQICKILIFERLNKQVQLLKNKIIIELFNLTKILL